jgi:copper chaperone CopZ
MYFHFLSRPYIGVFSLLISLSLVYLIDSVLIGGSNTSSAWGSPKVPEEKVPEEKVPEEKVKETESSTLSCQNQVNSDLKKGEKVLKVEGMVCAFCVQGIEIHLKKLQGIEEIKVDLEAGEVKLQLNQNKKASSSDLCEAIKRAGYKVTTIEHAP